MLIIIINLVLIITGETDSLDVDYPKYEDGGGDYESLYISISNEELAAAGGNIWLGLAVECENVSYDETNIDIFDEDNGSELLGTPIYQVPNEHSGLTVYDPNTISDYSSLPYYGTGRY